MATARTEPENKLEYFEGHDLKLIEANLHRQEGNLLIDLDEVNRVRGRRYCEEVLTASGYEPSAKTIDQFLAVTGGNPLFARDLIKLLASTQSDDATTNDLSARFSAIDWSSLPQNHRETFDRRILTLSGEAKSFLEIAAVEGQEFTAEVIAEIMAVNLLQVLEVLDKELDKQARLVDDISASIDEASVGASSRFSRFRFSHGFYQHYIYHNQIGPARLRHLHLLIGGILERLWSDNQESVAFQLAEHFRLAGEKRRAVKYFALAAQRSFSLADFEGTSLCVENGLSAVRTGIQGQLWEGVEDLFVIGAGVARTRGNFSLAADLAREGLLLLPTVITEARVKIKSELARSFYNLDVNFDEAEELLQDALREAKDLKSGSLEADIFRQLGIVYQRRGKYARALGYYLDGLRLSRDLKSGLVVADTINSAGVSFALTGNFDFAFKCHRAALSLSNDLGDRSRDTLFLNDSIGSLRRLGRLSEAHQNAQTALVIAEDQGKLGAIARAKYEMAQLARVEQRWGDYKTLLSSVLDLPHILTAQSPHVLKARSELIILAIAQGLEPDLRYEDFKIDDNDITGTSEMYSPRFVKALLALASDRKQEAALHFARVHADLSDRPGDPCWAWPFLLALTSYGEAACAVGEAKVNLFNRGIDEDKKANLLFGTLGVWKELDFYYQALATIASTEWLPPVVLAKEPRQSNDLTSLQGEFEAILEVLVTTEPP